MSQTAVPVLYMACCDGMIQSCRKLLTAVWNEIQIQFTSKENKYRNIKSRPAWIVLEKLQYQIFGAMAGYSLADPNITQAASPGKKPAAGLQDLMEEALALRFAIDWFAQSMADAQEFLDVQVRRQYKRPGGVSQRKDLTVLEKQMALLKEKSIDSFASMWTDDAELRGVASLCIRLFDGVEGPSALHFASTVSGQILLAMWKGVHPMLAERAAVGISRISEAHAQQGMLPPPPLDDRDEDVSASPVYDRIAASYAPPSRECKELVSALPRGVSECIVKVQATFRGYLFRARYFARSRSVAQYCKAKDWPRLAPKPLDMEEFESPKEKAKKSRKKAKKLDPSTLDQTISEFQPNVSKYLGGEGTATQQGGGFGATQSPSKATMQSTAGSQMNATTQSAMQSTMQSTMRGTATTMGATDQSFAPAPLHIRVTADHRACADLFALYAYSMYRRRELVRMWACLCEAYERGMDVFAELLNRNPALKPMLDSIAAQLKRGAVVGYDKAFIAKQQKNSTQPAKKGGASDNLFSRSKKATGQPPDVTMRDGQTMGQTSEGQGQETMLPAMAPMTSTAPDMSATGKFSTQGQPDSGTDITGEYLQAYLKETDGDDSQLKDISASVIPLSTGTSPPRLPPHEFLIKAEQQSTESKEVPDESNERPTSTQNVSQMKKPKLDVPFCMERVKPIWLPIKAHRFAVYRAKVLQLLAPKILEQYIAFEKNGQYASCIKLLESAREGSLNVLSPATLVQGKPLLVETVIQLIVGYSGLCLRNHQGAVAVKLITQVLDNMSLALRDLHPGHRTVLEAYLYDTALSVCYYMPMDIALTERSESFYQQATARYLKLGHLNRYCKCCLRAAAVLHQQGRRSEAEYYTQQALNKQADQPVSSLLALTYHNLAVHTIVQQRVADGVAHTHSYVALLRQLPKLGNQWMQSMDNTQWLILKIQELWKDYVAKESQVVDGVHKPAWASSHS
jgi:tetratricopeptide (TPR) repeat protein